MPLDPVSALSVAAAAVQFIDFSRKIVCKSKNLYLSADGALDENRLSETVTMRLSQLVQRIETTPNSLPSNFSDAESRLETIRKECTLISTQLIQRLHQLKVPDCSRYRRWKSFRQALKTVWSKSDIDAIARQLSDLRAELDTEMLVILREGFASMSIKTKSQLESLDIKTQGVLNKLLSSNSSRQEFTQRFTQLDNTQRSIFEKLGLENIQRDKQFRHLDVKTQRIIELLLERRSDHEIEVAESRRLLTEARATATVLIERDNSQRADRIRRARLSILDSLRFPDMTHRSDSISSAHKATFHWIFQDSTKYQKPWDNFAEWLVKGTGIYWIQGKPASGKSTLMRFVWNHSETQKLLKGWAGHAKLLLGSFYFWNKNDLIFEVFREEWEQKRDLELRSFDLACLQWSLGRLKRALTTVVELANESLKMCFFIDGLDEYEGDPGDIAEYIYELAEISPRVKFCVSARPLSIFQSVFLDVPGLKLQDLTQEDIKNYVNQKLGSERHMRSLLQQNPVDGNWLITEIVQRATGVFLWVILVVKSLIHGFRSGDSMQHLKQKLDALPVDLETLFTHIMERIEPEYQEEASKIFQIFRASNHIFDLSSLHDALLHPNYQSAIEMPIKIACDLDGEAVDAEAEAVAIEKMRLRLSSRCRGLLEASFEALVTETPQPSRDLLQPALLPLGRNEQTAAKSIRQDVRFASLTSLPWNALQLFENINTPACKEFASSHARAKFYLRQGRLLSSSEPVLNDPVYTEDLLYFSTVWLFNTYGGNILEWLHIGLVIRQDHSGATRLGLIPEWNLALREARQVDENDKSLQASQQNGPPSTVTKNNIATNEKGISSRNTGSYRIHYLHRTARDFLEKPQNWNRIMALTLNSKFDPQMAILMAAVVKVKTQPIQNPYETGVTFLKSLKSLKLSLSNAVFQLIDEYDRILSLRFVEQGGAHHWSSRDPNWKGPRPNCGDDLDSIAVQLGLTWVATARGPGTAIVRARQEELPLPFLNIPARPGLPLIGFAISFHFWAILESENVFSAHLTPDVEGLVQLLSHGWDPNQYFQGHTMWEYTLHQTHTHGVQLYHESKLECWISVFKAMLLHGADPYACCLHDQDDFHRAIGLVDKASAESQIRTRSHLQPDFRDSRKRGVDESSWDTEDMHPYYHSVTAIVADLFGRYDLPGTKELEEILDAQKKLNARYLRKKKAPGDCYNNVRRPDWVS
ncbi:hypothetical protein B0J14DRAFT_666740 [Halenospora varia]|nr:hypothetical protein B0J14DRAFT_666740 [Halenospora varia]